MSIRDAGLNLLGNSFTFYICFILLAAMTPCHATGVNKALRTREIQPHAQIVPPQRISAAKRAGVIRAYGRMPLYFIANRGQANGKVAFYEAGPGHATFFTRKGIVLGVEKREGKPGRSGHEARGRRPARGTSLAARAGALRVSYLRIGMISMNKDVQVLPEEEQRGKVSYFIGNDPHKWHTNLPIYKAVLYRNAYPGIDIKFFGNNSRLEYDIIVKPGADPSMVRFRYSGAKHVRVTSNGDLAVDLAEGSIIQEKPVVYQQVAGRRIVRRGAFLVRKQLEAPRDAKAAAGAAASLQTFTCSFDLGPYDRNVPLVIDPTLVYSTYLGGSSYDKSRVGTLAEGIAIDASGDAYVTGYTYSTDFPITAGAFQTRTLPGTADSPDGFVTEISIPVTGLCGSSNGATLTSAPTGRPLYCGRSNHDYGDRTVALDMPGSKRRRECKLFVRLALAKRHSNGTGLVLSQPVCLLQHEQFSVDLPFNAGLALPGGNIDRRHLVL